MAKGKKSRFRWWLLLLLLTAVGGLGAWFGYFKRQVKPILVQTEKVTRRNLTEVVVANGKVQPVLQVVINPEVSGEIVDLPVKEGQTVAKGEVLVRIKPDNYLASRRSAEAIYQSGLAGQTLAQANLHKAELEFRRMDELQKNGLVSDSQYVEVQTALEVAKASYQNSLHQTEQTKAALARVEDDLAKTTIVAPIDGTITRLKSQKGERVVGTALMAGTEIMTVSKLDEMEARVDIGEVDVILIAVGQKARLEVDAFGERKFSGLVTEIANAAKTAGAANSGSQEATKFEVKIRLQEKATFRPGMSVTAEIETRYRTNVLTVPIQSVTTRVPPASASAEAGPDTRGDNKKSGSIAKPVELVFAAQGGTVKTKPVKRGISDDNHVEILEGLSEGEAIVSGGYKAINRELEDGKTIEVGAAEKTTEPAGK
jgi:HlyD family secretion protein